MILLVTIGVVLVIGGLALFVMTVRQWDRMNGDSRIFWIMTTIVLSGIGGTIINSTLHLPFV